MKRGRGKLKMKKNNSLIWVVIAVATLLLLVSFGFRGAGGYGMMSMMYGSYGSGMMFFGWIFGALTLVALVLFIIWLVKQIQKR